MSRFRPIFIVGVSRSGTTMLATILDRHPSIAVPPETQYFHQVRLLQELVKVLPFPLRRSTFTNSCRSRTWSIPLEEKGLYDLFPIQEYGIWSWMRINWPNYSQRAKRVTATCLVGPCSCMRHASGKRDAARSRPRICSICQR